MRTKLHLYNIMSSDYLHQCVRITFKEIFQDFFIEGILWDYIWYASKRIQQMH